MTDANDLADAAYRDLVASETVTISKDEYDNLLHDRNVLNALYAGGVDNWEWYGESLANNMEKE